ncbi:MAG: histidine kinase [Rikenellaceae bacterium]
MKRSAKIVIDIMIAIAISLVVNFSHLLLIFVDVESQSSPPHHQNIDSRSMQIEGVFVKSAEGHGYIIHNDDDSVYVSMGRTNSYGLIDGDSVVAIRAIGAETRYDLAQNIILRNGNVVAPYSSSTPQRISDLVSQLLYYFALSLVVILVGTSFWRRNSRSATMRRLLLALLLAILLYFLAPLVSPRQRGQFIFNLLLLNRPIIDLMVTLKWSFAVIVSLLYSQIFVLISQRQNIILENERLRSESINAQYNMLMSQINPHVLFNSLNSLSMLVRDHDVQRSLTYIDQLSYTFRYILQNRESTLTTLRDEMLFVEAYIYMFKIRYADKLFFDIDIPEQYMNYQIPALSLQPLLDNAVKHNTIISSRPFHVSITVGQAALVVSNHKYPKLEAEESTGVGLENLSRRWELIAKEPIEVLQDDENFTVKLPLIKPATHQ